LGDLRIFPSRLSPRERVIYRGLVVFFLVVAAGTIWPIYKLFSGARPLILGLPLSLFYVTSLVVLSFCVLLALYRWEARTGRLDPEAEE